MRLSKDAVTRAVTADTTQYAPLEMKTAQDKLFRMERTLGEQDYEQARLLAEQAEVDANLAERKAQASNAEQTLKSARQGTWLDDAATCARDGRPVEGRGSLRMVAP